MSPSHHHRMQYTAHLTQLLAMVHGLHEQRLWHTSCCSLHASLRGRGVYMVHRSCDWGAVDIMPWGLVRGRGEL